MALITKKDFKRFLESLIEDMEELKIQGKKEKEILEYIESDINYYIKYTLTE